MKNSTVSRVQKHRAKLRAMGLRPVQLWVPNTKDPAFIAECRRQSMKLDPAKEAGIMEWIDAVRDTGGWV